MMKFRFILLIIFVVNCLLTAFEMFVISDDIIYDYLLTKDISESVIEQTLSKQADIRLFTPFFGTIIEIIKVLSISGIIGIGLIINEEEIDFRTLCTIVGSSRLVLFAPKVIALFWFFFIDTNFSFEDISTFHPFTIFQLIDMEKTDKFWYYPLEYVLDFLFWSKKIDFLIN